MTLRERMRARAAEPSSQAMVDNETAMWVGRPGRCVSRRHSTFLLTLAALLAGTPTVIRAIPADTLAAQIARGSQTYGSQCASCHGATLQGGIGPSVRLDQAVVSLPVKSTASDLAKWIRLNMPMSDPGSLSPAQSYDITAFLLTRSGKRVAAPLTAANAASVAVAGVKR